MVIILAVMVVIIMIFFSCQSSCVKNSCINIATCQSGFTVRGHWCVCPAGLKGYNCDEGKWHLPFCFLVWKHWWTKVDFLTELAIWYAENMKIKQEYIWEIICVLRRSLRTSTSEPCRCFGKMLLQMITLQRTSYHTLLPNLTTFTQTVEIAVIRIA